MKPATDHPNVTVEEPEPGASDRRRLEVEFLFLDRETCTRCAGTESGLEAAIDRVASLLGDLGVDIVVRSVHVDSADAARRTGLEVSPTIRLDGRDVQPNAATSACADCGEQCAADAAIDCRLWTYRGETHETPPVEFLVEALLRAAVGRSETSDARSGGTGRLSDDLEAFFGESEAGDGDERNGCC